MKRRYKIMSAFLMVVGVAMLVSHQWFYYYRPLDTKSRPLTVTKPESEFLYLANRARQDRKLKLVWWTALIGLGLLNPDSVKQETPGSHSLPNFLTAEVEHRGQILGLMYLNQVFRFAGMTGLPDPVTLDAQREARQRLVHYVALPETAQVLSKLDSGYRDLEVRPALMAIIENGRSRTDVRAAAKLTLMNWYHHINLFVTNRDMTSNALDRLNGLTDMQSQFQRMSLQWSADNLPTDEENAIWMKHARQLRDDLKANAHQIRVVQVKPVDRHGCIFKFDEVAASAAPSYADKVPDHEFIAGEAVPDFAVTLLDNTEWRLSEQKGKVVVIQFSFTGCGPCKVMYPKLSELKQAFGDDLSVLTLMRDPDLETTKRTASNENLHWSVAYDDQGTFSDDWGVRKFPSVFIIDTNGDFFASDLIDPRNIAGLLPLR